MSLGRRARQTLGPSLLLLVFSLVPRSAHAQGYGYRSFASGSLIIPMDIDYQDSGMLSAFGLVDALLRNGVPVWWCINPSKMYGTAADFDFTSAEASDLQTGTDVSFHRYRGGPFVVDVGDASRATPIVVNWQRAHAVNVHVAEATFSTPFWQVLTASPRIAVLASPNQSAAFNYLNAAGIPDENGLAWTGSSVDVLTQIAIGGGSLVDANGASLYSAILIPGWDAPPTGQALSWLVSFLQDPVLAFVEDQTVFTVENSTGHLLTTNAGLGLQSSAIPSTVQYGSNAFSPFFQMDARPTVAFQPDDFGAYFGLSSGSAFADPGIEMLRGTGAPSGQQDVWMAGFVDATCTLHQLGVCSTPGPKGRVAYLGGYYTTTLPISTHPKTQGTRLFLDALFAGSCTIAEAQPTMFVGLTGPNTVMAPTVTVSVVVGANSSHVAASNVILSYPLPPGAQFVSATNGASYGSGIVTWYAGSMSNNSVGGDVTMTLPSVGSYSSAATATYKVGNTPGVTLESTTLQTQFNCPNPGLVADWPADGNADDVTGNGHDGVLQNGATFAAGKVGSAFSLDGVDDNVSVPNGPALNFSNAMSVEGWINTSAGIDRYIAAKHDDSFYFAVGGGSAPHKLSFWLNGVSSSWFTGSTSVDDGQWHHVAATYDGSTMRLYVDGNLDGSAPRTGSIQTGTSAILIGARYDGTNASNFPGLIDELAFYNRALSPAEIQALAMASGPSGPCAAASVGDAPGSARALELSSPWPNPMTQLMNFEFRTPGEAVARAEIVDVAGRRVSRPLRDQLLPGGTHRFQWDGLDASGARVAPGIYLIRVTSGNAAAVQRIVMVR